jgi:hypothetical protein
MHPLVLLQVMVLLALANGTPVVAKKVLGRHLSQPLDGGLLFRDGRPLLGASKTLRGVLLAVLVTTAAAPLVGLEMAIGASIGAAAMACDLCSSFIKRRLALPPSSQAIGLDQVPESLFPLLACYSLLSLSAADIAIGAAVFLVGELVVSRLLYKAHLRDQPY